MDGSIRIIPNCKVNSYMCSNCSFCPTICHPVIFKYAFIDGRSNEKITFKKDMYNPTRVLCKGSNRICTTNYYSCVNSFNNDNSINKIYLNTTKGNIVMSNYANFISNENLLEPEDKKILDELNVSSNNNDNDNESLMNISLENKSIHNSVTKHINIANNSPLINGDNDVMISNESTTAELTSTINLVTETSDVANPTSSTTINESSTNAELTSTINSVTETPDPNAVNPTSLTPINESNTKAELTSTENSVTETSDVVNPTSPTTINESSTKAELPSTVNSVTETLKLSTTEPSSQPKETTSENIEYYKNYYKNYYKDYYSNNKNNDDSFNLILKIAIICAILWVTGLLLFILWIIIKRCDNNRYYRKCYDL